MQHGENAISTHLSIVLRHLLYRAPRICASVQVFQGSSGEDGKQLQGRSRKRAVTCCSSGQLPGRMQPRSAAATGAPARRAKQTSSDQMICNMDHAHKKHRGVHAHWTAVENGAEACCRSACIAADESASDRRWVHPLTSGVPIARAIPR